MRTDRTSDASAWLCTDLPSDASAALRTPKPDDVAGMGSDALPDALAAALALSPIGELEQDRTPKWILFGAGSLGGGDDGWGACVINVSTLSLTSVVGKKLGLHFGAALLGAFGVTGSGSSADARLRLCVEDTTLAACDTLLRFSNSAPKK
mgnify:CR=1 FL=1